MRCSIWHSLQKFIPPAREELLIPADSIDHFIPQKIEKKPLFSDIERLRPIHTHFAEFSFPFKISQTNLSQPFILNQYFVSMETRPLGQSGLELPILSFGASSLGAEFRSIDLNEAFSAVHTALDLGMNFIDTSPFYGRGMSEVMLGRALKGIDRSSYLLGTKLGRYSETHFDFSAKRVDESLHVSMHRMGTDYLDLVLLHDVEFVKLDQIWEETIPALIEAKNAGKVRAIGFSCYPLACFNKVLDHVEDDIDCVLSYNQYTLQNTSFADDLVPRLKSKGLGAINAGPFSARLLTNAELPVWLKEPEEVKTAARAAAKLCHDNGVDIAQLALQYSCGHDDIASTVAGSANPKNVAKWAQWLAEPIDQSLLAQVHEIFAPVKNLGHPEGLPENN